MLQAIREYTKNQGFYTGYGVLLGGSVDHRTRNPRHFRDPPAVRFLLQFDRHGGKIPYSATRSIRIHLSIFLGLLPPSAIALGFRLRLPAPIGPSPSFGTGVFRLS